MDVHLFLSHNTPMPTSRYASSLLLSPLMLALCQTAFAVQPPTAGSQLQQIPPAPQQKKAVPEIRVEQGGTGAVPAAEGQAILVRSLRISGATLFPEAELLAVTRFQPGSELKLSELRSMAARVTAFYRGKGYFVAQTYLPPQDIKDGVVQLAVLEGQYGQVSLRNQSSLRDGTANSVIAGINGGDKVDVAPLEQRLLLLSDMPGVNVKSTLTPGASVGASDLIIDITPGQRVSGSVDADNEGNRYTGSRRIGGSVNVNELLGLGDVASVRALSAGKGLKYGRAAYQVQLGKVKLGVAYASLNYELGKEFASTQAKGEAKISSLYGSYPLIRSRNSSLYVQLAYDSKTFQDRKEASTPFTVEDKKAKVLMASLNGDYRDGFGNGGLGNYSLTYTSGKLDLQDATTRLADALTAQSNGHYDKLAYSFSRQENLTPTFSVYAGVNGQLASNNLDASEKMSLGGADAVRAYPAGETNADHANIVTLEARQQVDIGGQSVQLIGFFDAGSARLNHTQWAGSANANQRSLRGAGVGLNWYGSEHFVVKASYAFKIGNQAATSAPDTAGRFWLQAVKYF